MTIDERLEKLLERHEALAQSVEFIADLTRQNAESIRALVEVTNQDAINIRALARVAENHENRIENLEEGK